MRGPGVFWKQLMGTKLENTMTGDIKSEIEEDVASTLSEDPLALSQEIPPHKKEDIETRKQFMVTRMKNTVDGEIKDEIEEHEVSTFPEDPLALCQEILPQKVEDSEFRYMCISCHKIHASSMMAECCCQVTVSMSGPSGIINVTTPEVYQCPECSISYTSVTAVATCLSRHSVGEKYHTSSNDLQEVEVNPNGQVQADPVPGPAAPPTGPRERKKRKTLTYAEKLEVVKQIDGGKSKRAVAMGFGINESTIRGIYKMRKHIIKHMELAQSNALTQARRSPNHLLTKTEQLLAHYVQQQAKRNMSVETFDLIKTALDLYKKLARKWEVANPPPFNASKGWVENFKTRHQVKNVRISGESASVNHTKAREYPQFLKDIMTAGQYNQDQIFNMDKTGFYWNLMPNRSFITKSSAKVWGRKAMKERFTVLFTTNATGSCRMKPTVIHRAKQPRAYKLQDMMQLNVNWMTSKKAWMSGKLSLDWFNNFFIPEVRDFCESQNIRFNILLLLDNAPGHSPLLQSAHPNVRVEFLPPNTTGLIQPMDQEIISCVKASYSRKRFHKIRHAAKNVDVVLQRLVDGEKEEGEEEEVQEKRAEPVTEVEQQVERYWQRFNVKEAIDLMVECWNEVTPATINHAWRNLLEGMPEDRREKVPGEPQSVEAEVKLAAEEAKLVAGHGFEETTADDIREMLTPPNPTVEDILEEERVAEEDRERNREEGEDGPDTQPAVQRMSEVKEIVQLGERLKFLVEQHPSQPISELASNHIDQALSPFIEILNRHHNTMRQQHITDFFNQHQQQQQPQPPAPIDDDAISVISEADFDGFEEVDAQLVELHPGGETE